MAKKKHHAKVAPAALRQAQLDAAVKYSSQGYALSQLLNQAKTDYLTQVRVDRGAARGVKASAAATIPKVKANYQQALGIARGQQGIVDAKVAPLSSAADDIKAAIARESGSAQRRIGEAQANAVSELQGRISQADAAAAYAAGSARSEYAGKRSQIQGQLLQLSKEKGLFTIAQEAANKKADRQYNLAVRGQNKTYQAAKLRVKATKRGQNITKRGQDLSHADRVAAANRAAAKGRGRAGAKGRTLTPGQQNAAIDQVNQARSYIAKLEANPKLSSHQIRQTLEQGYSVGAAKGKSGVKIPAFPHDVINAAYDLYANGVLSNPNIAALRRRKVKIPNAWRPSRHRIRIGIGAGTH